MTASSRRSQNPEVIKLGRSAVAIADCDTRERDAL